MYVIYISFNPREIMIMVFMVSLTCLISNYLFYMYILQVAYVSAYYDLDATRDKLAYYTPVDYPDGYDKLS